MCRIEGRESVEELQGKIWIFCSDTTAGRPDMQIEETIGFQIRSKYASLRSSEKKVADFILMNERRCRKLTLGELAKQSEVSQPTVVRFVKALGYDSFKTFRYRLIEEAAGRGASSEYGNDVRAMYGYPLKYGEGVSQIPARVVATTVKMLENALKSISIAEFERTVTMITNARRVVLFCVENSSATAKDLMTKLMYLGIDCRYDEDYYIQRIQAAALNEQDVAIGISYSGQSKDVVDVMKCAKKAGANTIAITNFAHALIGKWSDVVLCCSQEQLMYGDAIFSRTTQIAVVDMIYMGLLTSCYEHYTDQLDKNSRIIRDKAYEEKSTRHE